MLRRMFRGGMGFRIGLCAKGGDGTFADFRKIELIH